jgi:hypothetical protein
MKFFRTNPGRAGTRAFCVQPLSHKHVSLLWMVLMAKTIFSVHQIVFCLTCLWCFFVFGGFNMLVSMFDVCGVRKIHLLLDMNPIDFL